MKKLPILTLGLLLVPVGHGELASGLVGKGRMAEPEDIVAFVGNFFKKQSAQNQDLVSRTVLVTAGPTYEALDPVHFIDNRSSSKMGFAIVNELAQRGVKHFELKSKKEVTNRL